MMDFFKELEMDNSVIGNNEFAYGFKFLNNYMNSPDFSLDY